MSIGSPCWVSRHFGTEAATVVGGANPHLAVKCAAHGLDGPESGARGHELHRGVPRLERHPGALHAGGLDVRGRSHAHLAREGAGEVALAHVRASGERRHGEVLGHVVGYPGLELAERPPVGELRRQLGAELGLAAGALTKSTSQRAVVERRLAAEVLLHQRERQVHPGGHAGRGVHVAVAHEDRVRVHLGPGVALRRAARSSAQCVVARRPSSRPAAASRNAPVQTPATRRERPASVAQRCEERLVALEREHARAAGHDEGVDRAADRRRAPHRGRG